MNYIKQVRFFWKQAKKHSLGSGEIAMYFYLLEVCNIDQWENPINEPNSTLQRAINVKSYNTIIAIRKNLVDAGLIRFLSKKGSSDVTYFLYDTSTETFSNFDEVSGLTFSKNEEVADEVGTKKGQTSSRTFSKNEEVADEVGVSVLLSIKQKHKQIQSTTESHEVFAKKLFTREWNLDKENIELQLSPRRFIIPEDVEGFNRHLQTEGKHHIHRSEYLKHLRNWLNKKPNFQKEGTFQAKETGSKVGNLLSVNEEVKNSFKNVSED